MTVPDLRCSIAPAGGSSISTELLVLGPSLGTTTALWRPALSTLRASPEGARLRVLRFDLPGHGASPATTTPFTFAEVADAVVRLVDETGGGRFHYAGVSFGGAVGIELALRHPDRVLSLGIFNSDARIGNAEGWSERAQQVRTQGTPSLVGATPARWFAPGFIEREPHESSRTLVELSETDDESYALCCEALAGFDRSADVGGIRVPTIVVSGEGDPVTTPADLQSLAARIPGARYVEIGDASHLAALEQPAAAAEVLADLTTSAPSALARGMRVRREVLGDAHVDAAQAKITPETADFQDFLTRYAWGEVWNRPGLGRRERSIATLASLVTGGHENEIAMHVRAALTNGLARAEIAEVIMHTALYAGLPAANGAFAIARTVFADLDALPRDDGDGPCSA
jgi:3-oxoadipate enol-lactonase/4-carboxymuconolactone decarboxylase